MSDSESLVGQLRARRVVRGAIAHVVIAWLFVQIADVVFPYLGSGEESVRWVLVVSVATFPVTLFIAWLSDQPWSGSGHPLPEAVVLVLVAVAAGWWVQGNLPEAARERTSIVIMPFEHGTGDIDANLSRALTDEVASLLMRSKSIDVIAPESANSSVLRGLGTVAIADRLSVGSVLQGSVMAQGDSMRIELRLLDAVGELLWTGIVEDSFSNLMNVQARIAQEVEQRLGVGGEETVPVAEVAAERCWMPAEAGALRKYFTARHYIEMRNSGDVARERIAEAISIYQELLEDYPDFAEARAGLAWAYEYQATYDAENAVEDYRQTASALGAEALEDCPTLGEAMHLTSNQYDHPNRWIGEWQQLNAFIEMEPHKSENFQRLAWHYFMAGLWDRALQVAEQHYELNPLSVRTIENLAGILQYRGDFDRAIELSNVAAELGSTRPRFAEEEKKRRACPETDLDCLIDSLSPEFEPMIEPFRIIYRIPETEEQAAESLQTAYELFGQVPQMLNWFNGAACYAEHLTPLFFHTWEYALENNVAGRWFAPNGWGERCIDVHSAPEFTDYIKTYGLDEYWRTVEWPHFCQPRGETFACGRNISVAAD